MGLEIPKKALEEKIELLYQKNELIKSQLPYYPESRINKTEIPEEKDIFEANDYWFGNHLKEGTTFGVTFTYSGKIVILDRLKGSDKDKVLEHEKHHRNNISDSEYMTRKKTCTEEFYPNPTISPMGGY